MNSFFNVQQSPCKAVTKSKLGKLFTIDETKEQIRMDIFHKNTNNRKRQQFHVFFHVEMENKK